MADIVRLFDSAINAAQDRLKRRGQVGRINASGSPTVEVPGSGGRLVYVRLGAGGSDGTIEAVPRGVPKRAHVYVLCHKEDGQWVAELDTSAVNQNGAGSAGVAPHTHRRNSGNEYVAEAELFAPGVVLPAGGLTVSIGSFRYPNTGNGETYEGGTLDLTSHVPATAGKWRWVLVGIDPDTNAAVAVSGSDFDTQAELTLAEIDNVTFTGDIPLAAIQVANGDTALTNISRYYDAKTWYVPTNAIDQGQFLLLAGRSGGQTASGGTGANENLTLHSTSHATKGTVQIHGSVTAQYDQNTSTLFQVFNGSAGTAATATMRAQAESSTAELIATSEAYGVTDWQDSGIVQAVGLGDLILYKDTQIRFQNTQGANAMIIAGNKVGVGRTPTAEALEVAGDLRLHTDDNNYTLFEERAATQVVIDKVVSSGEALLDFNPKPLDGTSNARFRFFRETNTTGVVQFDVFPGTGSGTTVHSFFGSGLAQHRILSTTAALPVLQLIQNDVSEEFINFITTVGAGNPIDTAAIGSLYGKVRVAVNGTFKYIPLYNS